MLLRALSMPALACLVAGTLTVAPAAADSTGGTAPAGGAGAPSTAPAAPGAAPAAGPGSAGAPATGPNTLQPPPGGALLRRPVQLHGQLTSAAGHRRVLVQLLDPRRGWTVVAQGIADGEGRFSASFRAQRAGRFQVRALQSGATAAGASSAPTTLLEVLKPVRATYFGPGSYGHRTACGQTLTPQLLGIAHRTLPCGTLVDVTYGGRTISVPVVDRGPFVRGVALDLTAAAAHALSFDGSNYVGALALSR